MSESSKVQPHHLRRGAYLYIRQSSPRQVSRMSRAGKRQYALRRRAVALGWRDDQIIVIDDDRASRERRPPGAKVFNVWSPRSAWAAPASSWDSRSRACEKQRRLAPFARNLRVG